MVVAVSTNARQFIGVVAYWLIFAVFAAAAVFYASSVARVGLVPAGGSLREVPERRSIVLTAAGFGLIVLIGLRYRVGGDWANYLDIFRRLAPQELMPALFGSRQEPAYTLLNVVAARLGAGIWLVNLLCAVPFTYGLLALCRRQPNPWLGLLIATPFLVIVVGMGYTRQAAAVGCLMVGLSKLIEGKPSSRFLIWVVAGALFHRTVLVFLPVMFIAGAKNRFLSVLLSATSLVVAYYTVLPAAVDQYGGGYLNADYSAAGAGVRVMMDVVPALIVLSAGNRFYWSPEEKAVWRTYSFLCLIAGASLPFIHSSVIVDRLAIYLIPMQIFTYARIGYCFGLIRRGWLMWTTAIVLYSGAVLFVWLNYAVNAFAWIPYDNYLAAPRF